MEAKKDEATVSVAGEPLGKLPDGLTFRDVPTHIDNRGSVCEMYDPRWNWHPDPLTFAYFFTVRPGVVKGWGMHKLHEDRYFVIYGELEIVLFDPRREASTHGQVCKIVLSEYRRRIMNIPRHVWHAVHNIGLKDVTVVNFPTIAYNHTDPDKYRLPLDTDEIPYKFSNVRGW